MKNRWLRCVLIVVIAAIWAAMPHSALAEETCTMYVRVEDGYYITARHDPKRDSVVEMRLHRGDTVKVIDIKNGWAQVEGGEAGTAWCRVGCLTDYDPDEDTPVYTVVSNGRVRMRAEPDGKTAGYVYNGDTVEVQFIIGGWAYTGSGYVMAEYLEAVQ